MFKQLYFAILVGGLCASGVEGSALPARDLQSARDQPYTNAEAFARGLPPLPPRAVTPCKYATSSIPSRVGLLQLGNYQCAKRRLMLYICAIMQLEAGLLSSAKPVL